MDTRDKIAAHFDAPKNDAGKSTERLLNAHAPERNLRPNAPILHELVEEGEEGRRELKANPATQAALNESYKAQNSNFGANSLWERIKCLLKTELRAANFVTWIEPCVWVSLENNLLTLAVTSEFNRTQLLKRYGGTIRQIVQQLTGQEIRLKVLVQEGLEHVVASPSQANDISRPAPMEKSPWTSEQNPTNNLEVAVFLERYGDMRGVILNSPIFKAPCTLEEEGGWGIGVGAMIEAGKQYTLERLIWAIRQTKTYRGVNHRGKFFFHVLRKGLEGKKCS